MRFRFLLLVFLVFFFSSYTIAQNTLNQRSRIWDIKDFGAQGDGQTINTIAIQEAIDSCSIQGGGTVRIPSGVFLSGTLILKSKVELYLDQSAILRGSPNRKDYLSVKELNANSHIKFDKDASFLIYAEEMEHISIKGKGKIDGNGSSFWLDEMQTPLVRKPKEWRPRGLVCFVNSQFVNVSDVFLTNSPTYTLWLLGCDDVKIDGIVIRNPIQGPNTDGIDIDCSRRVTVSNCNIEGGDDAIAIKSDGGKLGEDRPSENIVVSNCILSSPPACGIRLGYEGDSFIRNCVFENIAMYDCAHGIDLVSIRPNQPFPFTIYKGTKIKNIQFNNISMQDVQQPIYMWLGNEVNDIDSSNYINLSDIRISNVIGDNVGSSFIGSVTPEKSIEKVFLSNICLNISKEIFKDTKYGNSVWGSAYPYGIYIQNVNGMSVDNLLVDFSKAKGPWCNTLFCKDAKNLVLSKIQTDIGSLSLVSQIDSVKSSIQILDRIISRDIPLFTSDGE